MKLKHLYLNVGWHFLVCQKLPRYHLDWYSPWYNAINRAFSERIKLPILSTHKVWLEQIPWKKEIVLSWSSQNQHMLKPTYSSIVLKNSKVQLHRYIQSLIVEGHQLTTGIPIQLGHVVWTVHPKHQPRIYSWSLLKDLPTLCLWDRCVKSGICCTWQTPLDPLSAGTARWTPQRRTSHTTFFSFRRVQRTENELAWCSWQELIFQHRPSTLFRRCRLLMLLPCP